MKKLLLLACVVQLSVVEAKETIQWWHSMSGKHGETVKALVETYNKSQDKYQVVETFRGNYTESLNAAIAAYRGKKQPHIVQVFEVGTMTMMKSKAVEPVHKLLSDNGYKMNWDNYLAPVLSYYKDDNGKLMSMPFNSSTPILYHNKQMMKKAGVAKLPTTWDELLAASKKIVASGVKCGTTIGWQSWVLIENFSAIHNVPIASNNNGYSGLDTTLKFNNPSVIGNISALKTAMADKSFVYEGRRSEPSKNAFTSGKCAFFMDSSSAIASLQAQVKFPWGASHLPIGKGATPKNSIIGGATLWVFKGHKKEEYKGVADFINYLASEKNQKWWHKRTGYLPISKLAYQALKKEGYYKTNPYQEVAVTQLMRGEPSLNSRGVRLGNFTLIREVINEELEKIWAGRVTPEKGMNAAVSRGNKILNRYKRTIR